MDNERAFLQVSAQKNHEKEHFFSTDADEKRAEIKASLTAPDKIKLLHGMILTRACDNALKKLFLSGAITYQGAGFQGKGFRSLGQEAIFGAPYLLRRGPSFVDNGVYSGDIAAPLIRDLGVFLAMTDGDVATVINAQAGKVGKPTEGRDLHVGDMSLGLVPPAAPLAIATCSLVGISLASVIKKESRVCLSFIGEGGTSLGEWHEAINFAAVHRLPMIFCIENNQTALSTRVAQQTRARSFADKGIGYGINALSIDGNDILEIVSTFKYAADVARAGNGPILVELVTMRMCGHAHHDDMLYLGQDPALDFAIAPVRGGYADKELYEAWRARDPIARFQNYLVQENCLSETGIREMQQQAQTLVEEAVSQVIARPWPRFAAPDEELVFKSPWIFSKSTTCTPPQFSSSGSTYLSAIATGIGNSFKKHASCFVIGEDVAPPYGNAFMMFKDVMNEFSERFINTPISENAIVGACAGMAMRGMRPIGEMQFNDFVACAMDQVINNVAKSYFRLGINLPLVLRMPYGGKRRAGPYHSQDTAPWFYRTPGLKIMAPSTPLDAMLMIERAVNDDDPVMFFEHIALYRDPSIRQQLLSSDHSIDGAALLREGTDLTIISYGAYTHVARSVAEKLASIKISADVVDLRYLMPIDFATIYASVKKTARVLLVGEDIKTGGILQSIAAEIADVMFRYLDAPVKVLGSRRTPVPYAPSLEDEYLLSEQQILDEALRLMEF